MLEIAQDFNTILTKAKQMPENTQNQSPEQLDTGTYEIIRNRLDKHAADLKKRLEDLNAARKEVFGSIETQLVGTDRIVTSNYCMARDVLAVGDYCIFGYNVQVGLRSGIDLKDVFSVYEFADNSFSEVDLSLLRNENFSADFQNLYRYYKEAFFRRFVVQGAYLYMVFQISKSANDFKAFKWLIKDDELVYIDARSDHEIRRPAQYEFKWERANRDMQRMGRHPHVSILDRVFVETVGGDLTIKVEDNTEDGLGIYREKVEFPDQSLDDAEYYYADLGHLIALKIRPYQEEFRYFVFNEKMQQVNRVDALEESGVMLPDGHGLIFANGYYLQSGEMKVFELEAGQKQFERRIVSPNGEDYLFAFYDHFEGAYVLLSYNVIAQKAENPIYCNGFTVFENGRLCYFKAEKDPTKYHLMQVWQTPFIKGEVLPSRHEKNYLYKVGNKDIVRAMSDCTEILGLVRKEDSYADLYADIVRNCTAVLDGFHWLDQEAAYNLAAPLRQLRTSAVSAIDEYQKKLSLQKSTAEQFADVETKAAELFKIVDQHTFDEIEPFVATLSQIRALRGEIISLRDLRYADQGQVSALEEKAAGYTDQLSNECVDFLLRENALLPYHMRISEQQQVLDAVGSAKEARELEEVVGGIGEELQLLIEVVSNLKIDDATQTTKIIDDISGMFSGLNQFKAAVKRKKNGLRSTEASAEFNAQVQLLDQSLINFLDLADTPAKCDVYLTKMMVQLEELEGRFAEFETFIEKLGEKREEIYSGFENRRLQLIESRNNRTSALQRTADRILDGMRNRVSRFKQISEINGFFASDLMAEKVRDIIVQLNELEDSNKANALQTSLKSLQEEAIRQLRDRQDLYAENENVIRFGEHSFSVNVQPLDLTIVNREGDLYFHLTGTNFYEQIDDEALMATKPVWQQEFPSEDREVYRAEYLAYRVFKSTPQPLSADTELEDVVKAQAATRYDEGYTKGVHDVDAALILDGLLSLSRNIGLLRFDPDIRAFATLVWRMYLTDNDRKTVLQPLKGIRQILSVFPDSKNVEHLVRELKEMLDVHRGYHPPDI